ncbi:hypothetical protein [Phycicoccus avicenniae]|uniref:hypothetical protein n=1 Tax=Phycicoccus avicenniae TaxID=2828860 RepID=UPI003D28459E
MDAEKLTVLYRTVRRVASQSAPNAVINDYGELGCCVDLDGVDPRIRLLAAVQQGRHDIVVHLPVLAREPGHVSSWSPELRACREGATRLRLIEMDDGLLQDLARTLASLAHLVRGAAVDEPAAHQGRHRAP